ncbi:MAG: phosphate signaling complex protein PhoU [Thermodesulfobacteriota bacterium]|nr:phosphate signaling complex protein PhoU [Thermodesulfobacteriota bacterium]
MHHNFHHEIKKLREKFMTLGGMVEDRIRQACSVIESRDSELIEKIINSDYEIDEMEIEIEEECLKILALYQPVAIDLRFIIAVIKINNEIERIADYAVKIAKRVDIINRSSTLKLSLDYCPMADMVIGMLKMSLDALVSGDSDLAHRIFILDDEVDDFRDKVYKTVKKEMCKQPEHAGSLLNAYLLARHLERIGDRATNIAEEVIYMVGGKIVRGEHN